MHVMTDSLTTVSRYRVAILPTSPLRTVSYLCDHDDATNSSSCPNYCILGHYIENTGNTTLHYLEILKSDKFQDVSLNQVSKLRATSGYMTKPHGVLVARLDPSRSCEGAPRRVGRDHQPLQQDEAEDCRIARIPSHILYLVLYNHSL